MARVEAYYLPEHRDGPEPLDTPEDIDALIDRMLNESILNSLAALYSVERPLMPAGVPDHELSVAVDAKAHVGALAFMDATGNWATLGSTDGHTDIRYYITGNEREFPDYANIPLDLLRQAVKEFLTSGGQRPTCVVWQEHDV